MRKEDEVRFSIVLKIPVLISILRETEEKELPEGMKIDGEYGCWYWKCDELCLEGEVVDTRAEAIEDAKDRIHNKLKDLVDQML